jgi:hypothetical protein
VFKYTNRYVAPYSPLLLKEFDCHVFVDGVCSKLEAVQYFFNYILKGQYQAEVLFKNESNPQLCVDEKNEIDMYLNCMLASFWLSYYRIIAKCVLSTSSYRKSSAHKI